MKILAVDDDPDMLRLYKASLASAGYDVLTAGGANEALKVLKEQPLRIVIADWMMPQIEGIELCRRIRAQKAERYVYVMLATAKDQRRDFLEAMDSGADDFVTKPVDFGILLARLRVARRILDLRSEVVQLKAILPICLQCQKIRGGEDEWQPLEKYLEKRTNTALSHTYCPTCHAALMEELQKRR